MSLSPLASGEPDEIDLELYEIGAIDDEVACARIARALDGPLAASGAELDTFRAAWATAAPGLPTAAAPPRRHAWGRRVLALAAVLLAGVAVWLALPAPEVGVRPMGGLPVDVVALRGGGALEAPYQLAAGDELRVAFEAPADGFVDVWTVQDDGRASVLAAARPVTAGDRFVLSGAARLDHYEGREWLVVQLTDQPRQAGDLEAGAGALLPDPARHASDRLWVLEVTRWR